MKSNTSSHRDEVQLVHERNVQRHGFSVQYVGGEHCSVPGCRGDTDESPFAYTIGLFTTGHPELLIEGVHPETALGVLNLLGDQVRAGQPPAPNRMIVLPLWPHCVTPEPMHDPGEFVLAANHYYRRSPKRSVPVLKLTYDVTIDQLLRQ